jgi:hypothetical protein
LPHLRKEILRFSLLIGNPEIVTTQKKSGDSHSSKDIQKFSRSKEILRLLHLKTNPEIVVVKKIQKPSLFKRNPDIVTAKKSLDCHHSKEILRLSLLKRKAKTATAQKNSRDCHPS